MDREKVIKKAERIMCSTVDRDMIDSFCEDVIALLEEQEDTINELQNAYGYLQKQFFEAQDELLKEQEAVEPKQVDLYGKDEWWGIVCVCPDCKAEWMSDKEVTHFCPKCGQAVKWE